MVSNQSVRGALAGTQPPQKRCHQNGGHCSPSPRCPSPQPHSHSSLGTASLSACAVSTGSELGALQQPAPSPARIPACSAQAPGGQLPSAPTLPRDPRASRCQLWSTLLPGNEEPWAQAPCVFISWGPQMPAHPSAMETHGLAGCRAERVPLTECAGPGGLHRDSAGVCADCPHRPRAPHGSHAEAQLPPVLPPGMVRAGKLHVRASGCSRHRLPRGPPTALCSPWGWAKPWCQGVPGAACEGGAGAGEREAEESCLSCSCRPTF